MNVIRDVSLHETMYMRPFFLLCLAGFSFLSCTTTKPKDYFKNMERYRKEYLQSFLDSERSPLQQADLGEIRFFKPDTAFLIMARYRLLPDEPVQDLKTSSGKSKPYRKYALLEFELKNQTFRLFVYESLLLKDDPQYANYLFLPFTDFTNGETSYGGGRYLDLDRSLFTPEGLVELDFNKAYNPWCAYSDGFNCPVPPQENYLDIAVTAGEKNFAGSYKSGTVTHENH